MNKDVTYRIYRPQERADDKEQIAELFAAQKLRAYLPNVGEDPSIAVAVIGERSGQIVHALIARSTVELHYVTNPEEPQGKEIYRLGAITEGALMQLGVQMSKLGFPVFTDAIAFIPKTLPRMIEFMKKLLHFSDEPVESSVGPERAVAHLLFKKLGS